MAKRSLEDICFNRHPVANQEPQGEEKPRETEPTEEEKPRETEGGTTPETPALIEVKKEEVEPSEESRKKAESEEERKKAEKKKKKKDDKKERKKAKTQAIEQPNPASSACEPPPAPTPLPPGALPPGRVELRPDRELTLVERAAAWKRQPKPPKPLAPGVYQGGF